MRRTLALSIAAALALPSTLLAQTRGNAAECAADNAGLKLPQGFCAGIFADSIEGGPQARAMAVAPNGDVFVAVQGKNGGVVVLRDANHDGRAEIRQQFASGFSSSQVALFDGHLYAEATPIRGRGGNGGGGGGTSTISIVRYPVKTGELAPSGPPDTIVTGLPGFPGHVTRNFTITRDGVMYVNVGSPSNACQTTDRQKGAMGKNPCTELETRAGIWRFDARKKDQAFASATHFARGIRNAVGIAINPMDGRLWSTQHGRDQLGGQGGDWDFDAKYNSENPAEELLQINQGDDFGWPYCYYAVDQHHLVEAPEYGGDGKKTGQCASKKEPVATFPGHWAPNSLFFYTGSSFPARYKNGAFIAFHGSWNRTGEPQAGFNVVFQPLNGEKAGGAYEVFADNFAPGTTTGRSTPEGNHRPTGLAQATDGGIYVSDDAGGLIYKIIYTGK